MSPGPSAPKRVHLTRPILPALNELLPLLTEIWGSGILSNGGPMERRFESSLEREMGWPNVSMVASCTIGLQLLLRACGLEGEVLVPALSHPATYQAVQWNGLTPVPVDVAPDTLTIDTGLLTSHIGSRASAILAVHLFGHPADVIELEHIASKHKLALVFDAAACIGVRFNGTPLPRFGHASSVSFHATKLLGIGEGGAITAADSALRDRVRVLRNFGLSGTERPLVGGTNGKLSELASAVGVALLPYLSEEIRQREVALQRYREELAGVAGIQLLSARPGTTENFSYAMLRVRTESGDPAAHHAHRLLDMRGIDSRRYFGGTYRMVLDSPAETPVADSAAADLLCVPLWGGMPESLISQICEILRQSTLSHSR